MKGAGLPDDFTADFTNHKDVQSLGKSYSHAKIDRQKAVSQLLQNPKLLIPSYDKRNLLATLPVNPSAQSLAVTAVFGLLPSSK